jgi:hypothetical protein
MPTVQIDESIERRSSGPFRFPLGVYPIEPLTAEAGFVADFESADGGEGEGAGAPGAGEWEEWPDRYMFDVLISAERLPAFCRALFTLMPGRVYPILDVLGNDAYREIDPYIAYDLVGIERFLDGFIHFGEWLLEDGLVGFGAMSMDPFFYVFIDEHKAVTIRVAVELRDTIKGLLDAFELEEVPEIMGPDAVKHEHRTVVLRTSDPRTGLHPEEIIEKLQDAWLLQLNIDTTANIDDDGRNLGVTPFRCVLRCLRAVAAPGGPGGEPEAKAAGTAGETPGDDETPTAPGAGPAADPEAMVQPEEEAVYCEALLTAPSYESAESMALDTAGSSPPDGLAFSDVRLIYADRFRPDQFLDMLRDAGASADAPELGEPRVFAMRWFAPGR